VEGGCDIAVGCSGTETATTITVGLGDVGTGALAFGEGAAALLAIRVLSARLEDGGLCVTRGWCSRGSSGRGCSSSRWSGSRWSSTGSGGGERNVVKLGDELGSRLDRWAGEIAVHCSGDAVAEVESRCDVAVRGCGTETAATIAVGLGDGGTGALASGEGAAALLAVRILSAWSGDEASLATGGVCLNTDGESDGSVNDGGRELHCRDSLEIRE